jgi:hypothetical protein
MYIFKFEKQKDGSAIVEVEYSMDEFEILKNFAKNKNQKVDEMSDKEIIQFSVIGILEEQLKKEKENHNGL